MVKNTINTIYFQFDIGATSSLYYQVIIIKVFMFQNIQNINFYLKIMVKKDIEYNIISA